MTTHSESLTGVQKELWYLINDEDARKVLETIIEKMKEVGDSSERIKQWREAAKAYIPDDPKYDENYWVAAYILHLSSKLKETIEEFADINLLIKALRKDLVILEEKIEQLEYEVEDLESDLEDKEYKLSVISYEMRHGCEDPEEDPEELEIEIEELRDTLGEMEGRLGYLYYERRNTENRLCELQYKREKLLSGLKEIAEHLAVS